MLRLTIQTKRKYWNKRREATKKRRQETVRSQQTMKKQTKKKIAVKTPKERQKKVTAQTQIATKIAKSHS